MNPQLSQKEKIKQKIEKLQEQLKLVEAKELLGLLGGAALLGWVLKKKRYRCPRCNYPLPDYAIVCPNCGQPLCWRKG
jgi:rubrerythrin